MLSLCFEAAVSASKASLVLLQRSRRAPGLRPQLKEENAQSSYIDVPFCQGTSTRNMVVYIYLFICLFMHMCPHVCMCTYIYIYILALCCLSVAGMVRSWSILTNTSIVWLGMQLFVVLHDHAIPVAWCILRNASESNGNKNNFGVLAIDEKEKEMNVICFWCAAVNHSAPL